MNPNTRQSSLAILEKSQDLEEIPLSKLNSLLGCVKNFYLALVDQGWALPKWSKNCISFNYLWNVFTGENFRIKRENLKQAFLFKKASKIYLFEQLNFIIDNLGFNSDKIPDKQWLLDILYTLSPKHEIFMKHRGEVEDPKIKVPMK